MSAIGKKMMQAAAGGGEVSQDDSFESFSGGVPDGWTDTSDGPDNGPGVTQSTSTGVTDGSSAVGFVGDGSSIIVGEGCSIEKDFDLTDVSQIAVDYTEIKPGVITRINTATTSTSLVGTGTKTVDVSGETGIQTVRLSIDSGSGDGKNAVAYDFEVYFDNLVFT